MKKLSATIFTLLVLFTSTVTAQAATNVTNEIENNDTVATAQEIQRNNSTAATTLDASYDGQHFLVGSLSSSDDVDWYKVSLPSGSQILTINSSDLSSAGIWTIYDSDGNMIDKIYHTKVSTDYGVTPYTVNIPSLGYYYIKVSTDSTISGDYRFSIGSPNYGVNSVYYNASSSLCLTTSTKSAQATYNLRNLNVPDNAVAYKVSINGRKTNNASNQSRYIKLASDSSWYSSSSYSYIANLPVSLNKYVKDNWMVKVTGNVSSSSRPFTLTPQLYISYVYAITPNYEK